MAEKKDHSAKYLSGLDSPEPPQAATGKDGDPQLAALHQFLVGHAALGPEDSIVDIGSGAGVLAAAIEEIWKNKPPPRYIAVDLKEQLEKLSLPTAIHNNSQKIEFKAFLESEIERLSARPSLVVIRNVFHELNIQQSAYLLARLNQGLHIKSTIYIQDMQRLPRAERGNAGWDIKCFVEVLKKIGMSFERLSLVSFSGIPWFAVTAHKTDKICSEAEIAKIIATQRRAQKKKMISEIERITPTYTDQTTSDIQVLSIEITFIELQLGRYDESLLDEKTTEEIKLGETKIPLRSSSSKQVFSVASDPNALIEQTGLVGVARTKEAIKIADLIERAQRFVWFAGYSNRLTFEIKANRDALLQALTRGIDFRAILCHPDSPVVSIRAAEPVYADNHELIRDIRASLDHATSFWVQASAVLEAKCLESFRVRLVRSIPPCSYFIIDDLCYAGFYTSRMSGGLAPSFLFKSAELGQIGFYETLMEEFSHSFEQGEPVHFGKGS
jgi:hypothetical protein